MSHSGQHDNINDSVAALEAKVGINGSAVKTSLDYLVPSVAGPTNMGILAWAMDPRMLTGSGRPSASQKIIIQVPMAKSATVTGIVLPVAAVGSGTSFLMGVFNAAGTQMGVTGDVHATVNASTGQLKIPLTATFAATAQTYYVMFTGSATTPGIGSSAVPAAFSAPSAGANTLWGTYGANDGVIPASITPSTITVATDLNAYGVGLY